MTEETAGEMLQRLGIDGKLWAEEMTKHPPMDVDTLLGWCCNMIMAGYDEAERRARKRLDTLEDITSIQCQNGNYDCNSYMHGMANGMILAVATLKDQEPQYISAPKVWLDDLSKNEQPTVAGES